METEFKGSKGNWELAGIEKTFVYALNEEGTNAFSLLINNDGRTELMEQQANAKLISCAPEMLEMLQYFLEQNMLSVTGEELAKQLIIKAITL